MLFFVTEGTQLTCKYCTQTPPISRHVKTGRHLLVRTSYEVLISFNEFKYEKKKNEVQKYVTIKDLCGACCIRTKSLSGYGVQIVKSEVTFLPSC